MVSVIGPELKWEFFLEGTLKKKMGRIFKYGI